MAELIQRLVLQGGGYYTFVQGEPLVVAPDDTDGGLYGFPRNSEVEVIANALRSGASMVQLVERHEAAVEKLERELNLLQQEHELFEIVQVERASGFHNYTVTRRTRQPKK